MTTARKITRFERQIEELTSRCDTVSQAPSDFRAREQDEMSQVSRRMP